MCVAGELGEVQASGSSPPSPGIYLPTDFGSDVGTGNPTRKHACLSIKSLPRSRRQEFSMLPVT